ncbi:Ldh family oxidoreductase [Haloarculaceae archaeon H-GB11]|nr:Ldh family oxidoreductase [Haloarculaceae archaeon H-GB11]
MPGLRQHSGRVVRRRAPGSSERRLSTNPIAFGIPTYGALDFPIVLDMATCQVANGKVRERRKQGHSLPEGWVVDDEGQPVRDPAAFAAGTGALQPLGGQVSGYKGFGLALVAELLAGIVGDTTVIGQGDPERWSNAAAFVFVDPLRFTTKDGLRASVSALARHVEATEGSEAFGPGHAATGDDALLPGQPEWETAQRRRRNGIPIPPEVAASLRDHADEVGVDVPPACSRSSRHRPRPVHPLERHRCRE